MDSSTWDRLKKNKGKAAQLLNSAKVSAAMLQLRWGVLSKTDKVKIERAAKAQGKGWWEEAKPTVTPKGIRKVAPIHHKVAIKKKLKDTLTRQMVKAVRVQSQSGNQGNWMARVKELKPAILRYKNGRQVSDAEAAAIQKLYDDNKNPEIFEKITNERYDKLIQIDRKKQLKERVKELDRELKERIKVQEQEDPRVVKEIAAVREILRKEPWQMRKEEFAKIVSPSQNMPFPATITALAETYVDETGEKLDTEREVTEKVSNRYPNSWKLVNLLYKGKEQIYNSLPKELRDTGQFGIQNLEPYVHENFVGQAVSDGKPVPKEVLAEYPGILKLLQEEQERALNERRQKLSQAGKEGMLRLFNNLRDSPSTITAEKLSRVLDKLGFNAIVIQTPSLLTDEQKQRIVEEFYGGDLPEKTESTSIVAPEEKPAKEPVSVHRHGVRKITSPEIELINKVNVKEKITPYTFKMDTNRSLNLFKKNRWQRNASRKQVSPGLYEVSWEVKSQEEIPVEGMVIRGLSKDDAEAFRNELKQQVKSIQSDILIREGSGGKYEVYTIEPVKDTAYLKAMKLFTKRFGSKAKRASKAPQAPQAPQVSVNETPPQPRPLMIKYTRKAGGAPEIIPIEQLEETIAKYEKEE